MDDLLALIMDNDETTHRDHEEETTEINNNNNDDNNNVDNVIKNSELTITRNNNNNNSNSDSDSSSENNNNNNDFFSSNINTNNTNNNNNNIHYNKQHQPKNQQSNKNKNNSSILGIDENKIGNIRLIKRLMSSNDIIELIDEENELYNNFYTTTKICSSSLSGLNNMLIEPKSILSEEAIYGKTNILTFGIIFHNTGTRLSSKDGRAYCILEIGNSLKIGPIISVFCFGNAYSSYVKKCIPGCVIGIYYPNLLPRNNNKKSNNNKSSNTCIISFSINDKDQLIQIGTSKDYGICKGTTTNSNNQIRCKNYVDTSISQYCNTHRKQQYQNANNGNINIRNGNNNMTFMQQLKFQNIPSLQQHQQQRIGNNNNNNNTRQQQQLPLVRAQNHQRGGFNNSNITAALQSQLPFNNNSSSSSSSRSTLR